MMMLGRPVAVLPLPVSLTKATPLLKRSTRLP
jgi:hypothetical protein